MPELPEVETVKLQLRKFLIGHKIAKVDLRNPKVFTGDIINIEGTKILDVRRFAKVLSIDLSSKYSLVIHIKLTGQIIYRGPNLKNPGPLSKKVAGGAPGPHTHVIFTLDNGGFLYYNDIRRFGWIRVLATSEVESTGFVGNLGPEPLGELTPAKFEAILGKTKKAIKVLLMDQTKIGGIGNIYANDALWLASIAPGRPANSLTKNEQELLYNGILEVLRDGIESGGASELAFVTPDGGEGNYQKQFLAYGQQGELCPRCKKEKFVKTMLGGRGTYFCPNCQRLEDGDKNKLF